MKHLNMGFQTNGRQVLTPHIHFKVTNGTKNIFTTQMYFAGEIENEQDMFLKNIKRKSSVIVEFGTLPNNEKIGTFDVIVGWSN